MDQAHENLEAAARILYAKYPGTMEDHQSQQPWQPPLTTPWADELLRPAETELVPLSLCVGPWRKLSLEGQSFKKNDFFS